MTHQRIDTRRGTRSLFTIVSVATLLLLATSVGVGRSAEYEIPTNYSVAELLRPEAIKGPHYRIRNTVVTYSGFMHHYTVDSDYGTFEVTGDGALRKLIREIHAIAALKEVKKSKVFLDGLKTAAARPLHLGKSVITHPVDTVTGIPKGVFTLFGNIGKGAKGTVTGTNDPSEDSRVKQAIQVSAYKREWADKLGVDPYSSNTVLQKDLNSLGWAGALGSLTVTAVTLPASAPAMTALKMARLADQMTEVAQQRQAFGDQINKMVAELPPARMRLANEKKLAEMGIAAELAKQYLDHPSFTPRHDAIIVESLRALRGAQGREVFLQMALQADSEEDANWFQAMVQILRDYHQTQAPITKLSTVSFLLVATAKNGTTVIPAPIDHGVWREPIDRASQAVVALHQPSGSPGKIEMWLTGTASPLARQQLKERGIATIENVDTRLFFVD